MRTTIDIADDVLLAAKEQARRERRSAGEVLSEYARIGLQRARKRKNAGGSKTLGFRPLPSRGGLVTNEIIDALREKDIY